MVKGYNNNKTNTTTKQQPITNKITFESDPEGLREGIQNKVDKLEALYKTDVIGTNADLEDIAAKYNKLIPPEEVEKHKEMISFLLETMDLKKVADARENGQGKVADKEFTKVSPLSHRERRPVWSRCVFCRP